MGPARPGLPIAALPESKHLFATVRINTPRSQNAAQPAFIIAVIAGTAFTERGSARGLSLR
jgi:hypothetical protein